MSAEFIRKLILYYILYFVKTIYWLSIRKPFPTDVPLTSNLKRSLCNDDITRRGSNNTNAGIYYVHRYSVII